MFHKVHKLRLLALTTFISLAVYGGANEISLSIVPTLSFPFAPALEDGLPLYAMGTGASLRGELVPGALGMLFTRLSLDWDIRPCPAVIPI